MDCSPTPAASNELLLLRTHTDKSKCTDILNAQIYQLHCNISVHVKKPYIFTFIIRMKLQVIFIITLFQYTSPEVLLCLIINNLNNIVSSGVC